MGLLLIGRILFALLLAFFVTALPLLGLSRLEKDDPTRKVILAAAPVYFIFFFLLVLRT